MRSDISSESLNMPRSESFADLNLDHHIGTTPSSTRIRSNFGKNMDNDLTSPAKPFGLGKSEFFSKVMMLFFYKFNYDIFFI